MSKICEAGALIVTIEVAGILAKLEDNDCYFSLVCIQFKK